MNIIKDWSYLFTEVLYNLKESRTILIVSNTSESKDFISTRLYEKFTLEERTFDFLRLTSQTEIRDHETGCRVLIILPEEPFLTGRMPDYLAVEEDVMLDKEIAKIILTMKTNPKTLFALFSSYFNVYKNMKLLNI